MTQRHRIHDVSDKFWKILEPHLPGREGGWGEKVRGSRKFINAVLWILISGSP
ncbi:hypothetical protein P618_200985 [Holospora obtusa F1]|uniref:Transposase n=1 Tax=Holospora obtusa F1 TaxID=1399147 RepID=W6TG86_HOLOB|nr:hypothetical protein P618_200985 [Holospora obtusa F1]